MTTVAFVTLITDTLDNWHFWELSLLTIVTLTTVTLTISSLDSFHLWHLTDKLLIAVTFNLVWQMKLYYFPRLVSFYICLTSDHNCSISMCCVKVRFAWPQKTLTIPFSVNNYFMHTLKYFYRIFIILFSFLLQRITKICAFSQLNQNF